MCMEYALMGFYTDLLAFMNCFVGFQVVCYISQVNMTINYGKDFTKDYVEFIATTDPSTFVTYIVEDYEFTLRGVNNFLTQYKVGTIMADDKKLFRFVAHILS